MKYPILFILLAGTLACGGKEPAAPGAGSAAAPQQIARVEKQADRLELTGTVRAADVAVLASRYGGFVREVAVRSGDKVRKGAPLVLLDDRGLQAQADKVKAAEMEVQQAIAEARQHMEAADAQRRLAANTFERVRALYEKQSSSKQEFEEAQSRRDAAEAGWRAAGERLAQAESKLRQVQSDSAEVSASLSYQRITSPFDGVVTSVPVDEGMFVNPGQTLVSVENPSRFQIVFSVEQGLLPALMPGATVPVVVPAAGTNPMKATIAEVSPSVDAATRTVLIKANLPDNPSMQGGLTGRVQVEAPGHSSLWIPTAFLQQNNDIETVLARSGNEWRRVLVKSGDRQGDRVEILSGLNEGDEIGLNGESR